MNEDADLAQTQTMVALNQASAFLQEKDNAPEFLKLILKLSVRHTTADHGYLLLRKPDDATYQVITALDSNGRSKSGDLNLAARTLIDEVVTSGQVALVVDAAGDERLVDVPVDGRLVTSYLVVPMKSGARVAGVICLAGRQVGHFRNAQEALVINLATQAALVVEKAYQAELIRRVEDSRSEFISLISHQVRVPLTAISGYTDMILNGMVGPMSERQEDFLRTIRRNIDRMSVLIDKLSEMNRIDAGRRKFNMIAFDLTEIIETAFLDLEEDIESRGQELVVDMDPSLPFVMADQSALSSLLIALIDNASRYSSDKAILSLQIVLSGSDIQITVVDEGIGISNADQSQIFTPFFRSEDATVRDHVGWGLSLAHSKKVIEALGGTIGFESQLGQGSNFFFTVPVAAGEINPS